MPEKQKKNGSSDLQGEDSALFLLYRCAVFPAGELSSFFKIYLTKGDADSIIHNAKEGDSMSCQSIVENELYQFSEKQLIIASRLYQEKLIGIVSEEAFYQSLGRLCDKGIIAKVSKGIYCRPRKTRYGVVLPSEQEIVETFTKNETGMVVGYRLYNALKLTTQISKNSEIYSSGFEGKTKRIGNVNMTHYPLKYSREVIRTVEWLEVLNHYYEIQDLNRVAFQNFLSEYAQNYNEDVCEQVLSTMRYPKKTIAFAHQALNYHRRENSLGRYLSSLSEYRIPSMEEIYETT